MTTCDLLIKKLEDEKTSRKEKLATLKELDEEIKRYESGDLKKFDSPIGICFRYHYNFHLQKLSN